MHFGKQAYSNQAVGVLRARASLRREFQVGEEGSLATRDVFHEGHICVADTQELTVKGWIRRGGTRS